MRYLNKIVFLNSAHVPHAEIKLDGNVHFIGTQGVGKSTLLRAILFFYNADKLRLGIPKEKKGFDSFYLPYDNSYIVYEVMRENGAYCVVVTKSMNRAAFRFIDAPYSRDWFVNEQKEVFANWSEIRKRIPSSSQVSPLINDYYVFRDIIFGNNKNRELFQYRKYAIVESANYQNIPRTIQNVFLNSKLDADFIKDTIIKSMNEDDLVIDLNVYRSLIGTFEQEYNDVMLWLKPNKNGVIEVRKQADSVIKRYRQLLYLKQQIKQERAELNYAEKESNRYLPIIEEKIIQYEERLNHLLALLGEEKEKFDKEHDSLTKEEGVLNDKLKTCRQKRKEYDQLNIKEIIVRVRREDDLRTEKENSAQSLSKLHSEYNDTLEKYNSLIQQLSVNQQEFENQKNGEILKYKEQFGEMKENLRQKFVGREKEERHHYDLQCDKLHDEKDSLNEEKSVLKSNLNHVQFTTHYKEEIEQKKEELEKLDKQKSKLEFDIAQNKLSVEGIRQNIKNELKNVELKYKEQTNVLVLKRDHLEEEIDKLNLLLAQQKGSLCEWLENNKSDWKATIGKVIDEECILYNQQLNPKILSDEHQGMFGVQLDLSGVTRELRTPSVIKDEIVSKKDECQQLSLQLQELFVKESEESGLITRNSSKKISGINEKIHLLEAQREKLPTRIKSLQVELLEWNRKEDEWKQTESDRINLQIGGIESQIQKLSQRLNQEKIDLQKKLKQISDELNKLLKEKQSIHDAGIVQINQQIEEKKREIEEKKSGLKEAQLRELAGKGADTEVIKHYESKIEELDIELEYISNNRHFVFDFEKDTREYFDLESDFQDKKKQITAKISDLKYKYNRRADKLNKNLTDVKSEIESKNKEKETILKDREALQSFREDSYFSPLESSVLEELPTKDSCGVLIEKLKNHIVDCSAENDQFKKSVNAFSSNFSAKNTFSFPTMPITDTDYSNYAQNICEFVEENKIEMYQTRISERYSNIIRRISKETGDLTKNESEIHKTINAINSDFVERNFTGVIRSIELRAQPTNDKLMQLLLEMKQFNEENQFNMGEVDLFSQESRTDVNQKAVRYLNSLTTQLNDDPGRKSIVLSDTFNLQFRIIENDNDTGWIEKISNVGSDGTDVLVKAMVNIMLINVFKEKASRKFGDFKLHCMMDEIGKLHPTNVKGILSFANCRNILLINSSPTPYNVEDYRYTYLLSKDSRANTKVVPLLTRK